MTCSESSITREVHGSKGFPVIGVKESKRTLLHEMKGLSSVFLLTVRPQGPVFHHDPNHTTAYDGWLVPRQVGGKSRVDEDRRVNATIQWLPPNRYC